MCKEIPPSFGPSSAAAVVIAPRRWQQKRTHYQFAFPWPRRIFCFGAAYVSGIKETAPGETPRSRLKRRIVEVEEEGRRRSVQSDALERARNWGTFSHLYHYYYTTNYPQSRLDNGPTDGRLLLLPGVASKAARPSLLRRPSLSTIQRYSPKSCTRCWEGSSSRCGATTTMYFYEAASSKRHCIPPVEFQQSW